MHNIKQFYRPLFQENPKILIFFFRMTSAQAPGLADVPEVDTEFKTEFETDDGDVTDRQSDHDDAGNFQFEGIIEIDIHQVDFDLTMDTDSGIFSKNNSSVLPSRNSDTTNQDTPSLVNHIDDDSKSLSSFSSPASPIRRSQSYSEFSFITTEQLEANVDLESKKQMIIAPEASRDPLGYKI